MRLKLLMTAALLIAVAATAVPASARSTTAFSAILKSYDGIRDTLAADSIEGASKRAATIARIAQSTLRSFDAASAGIDPAKAEAAREALRRVESSATALSRSGNLAVAREVFGDLSNAMIDLRTTAVGERERVATCPMAKKSWIQPDGAITNPYYGSSMPKCGEFVE